jgi:hypothetical protein
MDSLVGDRDLQIGHVGKVRSGCRGDGETIRVILDTAASGVEQRGGSIAHTAPILMEQHPALLGICPEKYLYVMRGNASVAVHLCYASTHF